MLFICKYNISNAISHLTIVTIKKISRKCVIPYVYYRFSVISNEQFPNKVKALILNLSAKSLVSNFRLYNSYCAIKIIITYNTPCAYKCSGNWESLHLHYNSTCSQQWLRTINILIVVTHWPLIFRICFHIMCQLN